VIFFLLSLIVFQALEVVPRILLDNSGVDSTHAIASLVAAHQKGQKHAGVSIETGQIQDAASDLQVLDSLFAKRSAIQLATDAATTILRVDQVLP
jgi:chaperonin GroEL (HSP60 family)